MEVPLVSTYLILFSFFIPFPFHLHNSWGHLTYTSNLNSDLNNIKGTMHATACEARDFFIQQGPGAGGKLE